MISRSIGTPNSCTIRCNLGLPYFAGHQLPHSGYPNVVMWGRSLSIGFDKAGFVLDRLADIIDVPCPWRDCEGLVI